MSSAANGAEIRKMWGLIEIGAAEPVSLRAIGPKGTTPLLPPINRTFTAADWPALADRQAAFEAEALRLNGQGYNVYVVMNPVRPGFGAAGNGEAVRDVDITCRRLLLIDIDRAADTRQPASREEVEAAGLLASRVGSFLMTSDWPAPVYALSGNGMHIYYRLDNFANDAASAALVRDFLHGLARKFDAHAVKIDTSVSNASRITKVPGTVARKGLESTGRPYRIAALGEQLNSGPVDLAVFRATVTRLAPPVAAPRSKRPNRGAATRPTEADTPRRRARLTTMLACISADCSYALYRDAVWAILGTGWDDSEAVARAWCQSTPSRFDPANFSLVVASFDPDRDPRPSLATIAHHARKGGWNG